MARVENQGSGALLDEKPFGLGECACFMGWRARAIAGQPKAVRWPIQFRNHRCDWRRAWTDLSCTQPSCWPEKDGNSQEQPASARYGNAHKTDMHVNETACCRQAERENPRPKLTEV